VLFEYELVHRLCDLMMMQNSAVLLLSSTVSYCLLINISHAYILGHRYVGGCRKLTEFTSTGLCMAANASRSSRRKGAMSRKRDKDGKSAKGFGAEILSKAEEKRGGDDIYSLPALYDLAFGYRNYEFEARFLIGAHKEHNAIDGLGPNSIIELAAGPARHSMTALKLRPTSAKRAIAIDISKEMAEYNADLVQENLGSEFSGNFQYLIDDMRHFTLREEEEQFDSAWILLGSMSHLKSNVDVINCFRSARKALKAGGTLIVELPHPRETFTMVECTRDTWEVPVEGDAGEDALLTVIWGDDDDDFSPITQIRDFSVSMDLTDVKSGASIQKVQEKVPMRLFTAQEIDAISRYSGFEVAGMYGALDKDVDVHGEEAFRLVCVLRACE